ncbi:flagellar hook-associated protein FlgK [Sulfobacillus thermosulfidooxidans]|uniref:flagellar hook-associated protein FlgK n=1 Tax=Sulfobacillus thermosulfidooxidans TaxID=28034 RepID=UPI0002FD23C9|nr:flagellar hook-associated protein FlgK [Sulfobacillus thermosulfidooxidans]
MSFTILNIASRSLAAEQLAMEVTGNNMANATTPGYRRETANLVETPPIPAANLNGTLQGQGVSVDAILRAQDAFLSRSVRTQFGSMGYWKSLNTALSQIQNVFQEPSASGLSEAMTNFFNAWLTLSQTPTSLAARQAVLEQGKSLASTFNTMSNELNQEIQNLNNSVTSMVGKINTITSQIAKLNTEIANVSGSGGTANALLDQRGLLMDQLSQLVNISYTVNPDQTVNIYLGSNALVVNQKAYSLITGPSASSPGVDQVYLNDNPNQPLNSSTGLTNGELAGLIKAGSIDIPNYLSQLNTLAESVANAVNSQQTQGYQLNSSQKGGDFFVVPTSGAITASTIQVNPQLTIQGIAAASNPNSPNDGSNAQIIANLVYDTQSTLGNYTFSQYYTNLVGQVGNDGQHAQNQYNSANSTLQALRNARQSATGVDLNQSSAHLIQEQQSYQAAAQLVSVEQTIMTSLLQAVG